MTSKQSRIGDRPVSAEFLEPRHLLAATLVKDINTSRLNATFTPAYGTAAGSVAYFTDHDGTTGDELWKTDGTTAGTVLVKDINPGPAGSYPGGYTTLNGVTYFNATDATNGAELWRTNGTAAGTYPVADINPGLADSDPADFVVFNGRVLFFADDGVHGRELWRTDGTAAGTALVVDTQAGSAGQPLNYTSHRLVATGNGKLFFYATSGSTTSLYVTTGDIGNQTLLKTSTYGVVDLLATTAKAYYFDNQGYLYASDGTVAGTVTVDATNSSVTRPTVAGGYLYYTRGATLYATEGTIRRTVSSTFSSPTLLSAGNGVAYFSATNTATAKPSLWFANVGGFGAVLVKDNVTPVTGAPAGSGFAYVTGTPTLGYALNLTAGTTSATVTTTTVATVNAGGSLSAPTDLVGFGSGELLFVNTDPANGTQPWISNLTAGGTGLLKAIYPGTGFAEPFPFRLNLNGHVLFQANDGVAGPELWSTDGTSAGTTLLKDINPGSVGSSPSDPLLAGNKVYFAAYDTTDGSALFATDGTTAGTAMVPGTASTDADPLAYVNGAVLFAGDDATHGSELWRTDGTAAGTSLLADLNPGTGSSSPSDGVVLNGVFYFPATDAAHGTEMWRSDGTSAGTYLLADVYAGTGSSSPSGLFVYGDRVLFAAATAGAGTELWSTDGTTAGTALLKDVYAGTTSGGPSAFALYNGRAYFSARDATGTGLWSTDGTAAGTTLVAAAVAPQRLIAADGLLFFVGADATRPGTLFTSRGTAATTAPITSAALSTISGSLYPIGGRVFFIGTDSTHGSELWSSDGTAAGTNLVQDLFPGIYPGVNSFIVGLNSAAYFSGNDGVSGSEIYKVADTFPPELTAAAATVPAAGPRVSFTFGENVSSRLSAGALQLTNLSTNTTQTAPATAYAYDPATNTATFALPASTLAEGRYRATLAAASIVDPAGNAALAAASLDFLVVTGAAGAVRIAPSTDGTTVVVTKNGTQTFTTPLAGLGSVVVTGAASTTAVAVALPGGFSVDGTGGVTVVGTTGAHVVTAAAGGLTFDITAVATAGAVSFDPAGGTDAVTVNGVRLSLASAPAANTARVFSSLALSNGGTLDTANNDLVLTGSALATVTAWTTTAYAGGKWSGPGLASSAAASDPAHLTALGVIQNVNGTTAAYTTFDGVAVTTSAVLVKYTDYGDTNLDGRVDVADYTRLDAGFVGHLAGWANGDVNYDGTIDGSDYTLVDNAFNLQPLAATTAAQPAGGAATASRAVSLFVTRLQVGDRPDLIPWPPSQPIALPAPSDPSTRWLRRSLAGELLDLLR